VNQAIERGSIWSSAAWMEAMGRARAGGVLHLIGLLSDGNVHSHVDHSLALLRRAVDEGAARVRLHVLTDGRDVAGRSALRWVEPLEAELAELREHGVDARIATGGGRMLITMDRYEADWDMVERGWRCHVLGEGPRCDSASEAIRAAYAADPALDDQWLPSFVVGDYAGMADGDAVLLSNFRGDRAIELSRAFDEGEDFDRRCFDRRRRPRVSFAGMMEYDGDQHIPRSYLVRPPQIEDTVGQRLAAAGRQVLAVSETQKFGHVTYFYNGNRSGALPGERQLEIPSDRLPFDQAPQMKAAPIAQAVAAALREGGLDLIRVNFANGDMVGHTGRRAAAISAMEAVDAALGLVLQAVEESGALLLLTADHGNADEMWQLDRKKGQYLKGPDGQPLPSTAHSLNPVPCLLCDPRGEWRLSSPSGPVVTGQLAQLGATVLQLCGLEPPATYLPGLVVRA
jgi:2,3-bisphosphoglycerate-independent phosphoglycerate mutase